MRRIVPLLVLATALVVGCNQRDQTDLQRDAGNLAGSATRALGNLTVAGKVTTALSLRKGVSLTTVRVEAEGGHVTLSGTARSAQEKRLIEEIARETRGVENLTSNLTVEK